MLLFMEFDRVANTPSIERLREVLDYCPETGELRWKLARRKCALGALAGSIDGKGYVVVGVDRKIMAAHRVIWAMVTGEWPREVIDHINQDRADNRWCNIRSVTQKDNTRNARIRSDNTSGVVGVTWNKRERRWHVHIVKKYIGRYLTKEAAIAARKSAEKEYGFHENHGRQQFCA